MTQKNKAMTDVHYLIFSKIANAFLDYYQITEVWLGRRVSFALWATDYLGFLPAKKSFAKATDTNLLYANDFPDPLFKYCSNSRACLSVSNAPYQTKFHGK